MKVKFDQLKFDIIQAVKREANIYDMPEWAKVILHEDVKWDDDLKLFVSRDEQNSDPAYD